MKAMTDDTDRRGYELSAGAVPGETLDNRTFRIFNRTTGNLAHVIVGTRTKATRWTKQHSISNPDIRFSIRNGAYPCGTWQDGDKISG